jgi:hypothetical protein
VLDLVAKPKGSLASEMCQFSTVWVSAMSVCVTLGLASGYGSSQGLVSLLCVCVCKPTVLLLQMCASVESVCLCERRRRVCAMRTWTTRDAWKINKKRRYFVACTYMSECSGSGQSHVATCWVTWMVSSAACAACVQYAGEVSAACRCVCYNDRDLLDG